MINQVYPQTAAPPAPPRPHALPLPVAPLGSRERDALIVRIGREYLAVWLTAIAAHLDTVSLRTIPDAAAGVAGLLAFGERFLVVYRPEHALGVGSDNPAEVQAAIVLRTGESLVALAIDEAVDVRAIDTATLRRPPALVAEDGVVTALAWCDGLLVTVIDPGTLASVLLGQGPAERAA
ncbi:MAG: chemotaxis protein CheW [Gemmatimonadaceae bacterium]